MKEWLKLVLMLAVLLAAFLVPMENETVRRSTNEAFLMLQDYARRHVLLCLVPAFFIAGAISVFVSQASVMKYLGPRANKPLAYGVASVSGTILAVCSCTVLPLFAGIYTRGAGIGPACAFLYSGPAINVLAIILTARVLGMEIGVARAVGAVGMSILIGLLMHFIYRKEEQAKADAADFVLPDDGKDRPLWKTALYFAAMIGILVFANWGQSPQEVGIWNIIYGLKWFITGVFVIALAAMLVLWFRRDELKDWVDSTWTFTKQIFPLLFAGVLVAGFLLGRPGKEALIPNSWIAGLVGGNSIWANLLSSVAGALMYFATLTEVPILQGLMGSGMGNGPALALLLAGPALSLPSMIVIGRMMGVRKAAVYILLVVGFSTIGGIIFGVIYPDPLVHL